MNGILDNPIIFNFLSVITGDVKVKRKIIDEFIKPFNGAKILDIGCGTGQMLKLINENFSVSCTGFDINARYVNYAKQKNNSGNFFCADITNTITIENDFDIVIASDILHHLNNTDVMNLIEVAKKSLKPNGHFIAVDPIKTEQQNTVEKYLMKNDRGKYIRAKEENLNLLKLYFSQINTTTLQGSYFIPWTECVFQGVKK